MKTTNKNLEQSTTTRVSYLTREKLAKRCKELNVNMQDFTDAAILYFIKTSINPVHEKGVIELAQEIRANKAATEKSKELLI
jgi:hypothetical protein